MPTKTKSPSATSTGPKGRNRKNPKDALKLVKPGVKAGLVTIDKVLITFADGSKGIYWATPIEKKKREAARKSKANSKKTGAKKKAKKTAQKRGVKKTASKAGRPRQRIAGTKNLQGMSSDQLISLRKAIDGEISARIATAEKELGNLKKLAS